MQQPALNEPQTNEQPATAQARPPRLDLCIEKALSRYFAELDGHLPSDLYRRVLEQVEPPMLEMVMISTRGNQSKASEILGISRGTLRTKLKRYGMA